MQFQSFPCPSPGTVPSNPVLSKINPFEVTWVSGILISLPSLPSPHFPELPALRSEDCVGNTYALITEEKRLDDAAGRAWNVRKSLLLRPRRDPYSN